MNQQVIIESNSFNSSGFGSSFNSMQSDSDLAWCYAKHVVDGNQSQQKPFMNDPEDGWFTCSEHSDCDDESGIPTDDDESESTRNEHSGSEHDNGDIKQNMSSNRQKRPFRPRFQRQTSIASNSSANRNKERTIYQRNRKSPNRTRGDSSHCTKNCDVHQVREARSSNVLKTEVIIRNEPNQDERRRLRRLELARMKSKEVWGSSSESDSEGSQIQRQGTMSVTTPTQSPTTRGKMFRKKSYVCIDNESLSPMRMKRSKDTSHRNQSKDREEHTVETESERSCSPSNSFHSKIVSESTHKNKAPKVQTSKQAELLESESERSSSPSKLRDSAKTKGMQQPTESESGRSKSAPKIRKQSNVNSSEATNTSSQRSRSTSPVKTNGSLGVSEEYNVKQKANSSVTEKKYNKYEMIPTGSLRQNRSSLCTNGIKNNKPNSPQRQRQSYRRVSPVRKNRTENDLILSPSHNRAEEKVVSPKRSQSLEQSEHGGKNTSVDKNKADSTLKTKTVPPCKVHSLRRESSFTEKKKMSKKLDESLLMLTRKEQTADQETEETIPKCEKSRYAITPVPNREYSSHSSVMSSPSITSPCQKSTTSSSSGSGPTYKNTVEVKNIKSKSGYNKKHTANEMKENQDTVDGTKHVLDDILKSRRFRNSNLELQKKTQQYLVAVQTTTTIGCKSKVSTMKPWR